jgi:hypothetical protein
MGTMEKSVCAEEGDLETQAAESSDAKETISPYEGTLGCTEASSGLS